MSALSSAFSELKDNRRKPIHQRPEGMAMAPNMILSAFFFNPQGDHRMSWRHPHAAGREVFDFDFYKKLLQDAERAKLDTLFVTDHVAKSINQ